MRISFFINECITFYNKSWLSSKKVMFNLENAGRQSIDIVPAMDADIGKNTIQRYELVSGESRLFALTATPTLDGTLLPSLVIKKALDREHVDGYLVSLSR